MPYDPRSRLRRLAEESVETRAEINNGMSRTPACRGGTTQTKPLKTKPPKLRTEMLLFSQAEIMDDTFTSR